MRRNEIPLVKQKGLNFIFSMIPLIWVLNRLHADANKNDAKSPRPQNNMVCCHTQNLSIPFIHVYANCDLVYVNYDIKIRNKLAINNL